MTINLNYLHILTIIFVIAKLMDKIDWSWFTVFIPSMISVGLGILVFIFAFVIILISQR